MLEDSRVLISTKEAKRFVGWMSASSPSEQTNSSEIHNNVKHLLQIGPDSDAAPRERWHVYCGLVCYRSSAHFRLPTSLLIGYWLDPRINTKAAWLASCNLIWKRTRDVWQISFLFGCRGQIFPLAPQGGYCWSLVDRSTIICIDLESQV